MVMHDFCKSLINKSFNKVLQTETHLTAGEIGVIRGGNYAWSNRSDKPAVVVVATHDATD